MSKINTSIENYILNVIEEINRLDGYDVVIVCTSTSSQAEYWQERLMLTRGIISSQQCRILAVYEDWHPQGAGNGLGTLYAYYKAVEQAKQLYQINLNQLLKKKEISIALYHTAGKGTRLAPLPGSENNNKPGVKLPIVFEANHELVQMTILEAVIKQTGIYAASRKGRLSVFWGDQIFIPSANTIYEPLHHVDILATLAPMPSKEEWVERGLEKYGLIVVNEKEDAAQVEKVSYETATRLLSSLGKLKSVGTSLGSFSISEAMLQALLEEFKTELIEKQAKLDTDPHFWMPITLEKNAYMEIMKQKKVEESESGLHYDRMRQMISKLKSIDDLQQKKLRIFGCVDVGYQAYWWDYGQLKLFIKNNELITNEESKETRALRLFLGITSPLDQYSSLGKNAKMTNGSVVLGSTINKGTVNKSVLSGVYVCEGEIDHSILINVTVKSIKCKNCVVYNVVEEDITKSLHLEDGTVLVGVWLPNGEKLLMKSKVDLCGGKHWSDIVESNKYSFENIYKINTSADIKLIEQQMRENHAHIRSFLEKSTD